MIEREMFRLGNYLINKNQVQFIKVCDDFSDIRNWNGIEIFFSHNRISIRIQTTKELEDLENVLKNEGLM